MVLGEISRESVASWTGRLLAEGNGAGPGSGFLRMLAEVDRYEALISSGTSTASAASWRSTRPPSMTWSRPG
jgi:hypothetical protein